MVFIRSSLRPCLYGRKSARPPGPARTPEIPGRRASHSKVRKCLHDKRAGNGKSARLTGPAVFSHVNTSARVTEMKIYCVCVSECVYELVS